MFLYVHHVHYVVRNRDEMVAYIEKNFGMKPSYLTDELDHSKERYQYYVHGFEQSRRFRGLKVWMSFKRYGARQIGEWIDNNVRQARHLYSAGNLLLLCADKQ